MAYWGGAAAGTYGAPATPYTGAANVYSGGMNYGAGAPQSSPARNSGAAGYGSPQLGLGVAAYGSPQPGLGGFGAGVATAAGGASPAFHFEAPTYNTYAGNGATTTTSASNPYSNTAASASNPYAFAGGAGGVTNTNAPNPYAMAAGAGGVAGTTATAGPTIPSLFGAGGGFQFFSGPDAFANLPDVVRSHLDSPPAAQQPMQPTMQGPSVAMPDFMGVPPPAHSPERMVSAIPPLPFGQAEPQMPVAQVQRQTSGTRTSPEGFQAGDHIEVWSKSLNNWCPGVVEYLEGYMVYVKFRAPQGNFLQKAVPNGHQELRLIKSAQGELPRSMPRNEVPASPRERPGVPLGVTCNVNVAQQAPQPYGANPGPGVLVDTEEDIVDAQRKTRGTTGLSMGAVHGNALGSLSLSEHVNTGDAVVQFRVQKHASNAANDIVHEAMFMAKFVNREKGDQLDRDWNGPNGQNPLLTLYRTGEAAAVANAFERLSNEVQQILASQPSLVRAEAPCKVYGDIHGQFRDMLLLLHNYGFPSETGPSFIFNGDWGDRGAHQLEVISLVFGLKILFPNKVWLIRGNHEDPVQNQNMGAQGLEAECHTKMGAYGGRVFQAIHGAFAWLPLGCVINNRILVVHGGIGSGDWPVSYLENLPAHVARPLDHDKIPQDAVVYNVLWSDPIPDDGDARPEITGVHDSPRDGHANMIVTFGRDITERFCQMNNLDMIIRSHQALVRGFGYDVMHGGKLVRVFSARDYEGSGNDGCVLHIVDQNGHLLVRPQVLRSHAFPKEEQVRRSA